MDLPAGPGPPSGPAVPAEHRCHGPTRPPGPGEPPTGLEWAFIALFNSLSATLLAAGLLAWRSDADGELLQVGVVAVIVALGPTGRALARWWRHR